MNKKIIKTQEEARQYVLEWRQWARKQTMHYIKMENEKDIIEEIGRAFGLLEEFKKNGILQLN